MLNRSCFPFAYNLPPHLRNKQQGTPKEGPPPLEVYYAVSREKIMLPELTPFSLSSLLDDYREAGTLARPALIS